MPLTPRWPRELLYFPLINPPRHIINHALLYWDGLATVAPEGMADSFLRDDFRALLDEGLARTIPAHTVWGSKFASRDFLEGLEPVSDQVLDQLANISSGRTISSRIKGHLATTTVRASWTDSGLETSEYAQMPDSLAVMLDAKVPSSFLEELVEAGLARRLSKAEIDSMARNTPNRSPISRSGIVLVTPSVQTALLSVVAHNLAARHHVVPHTDSPAAWCQAHGLEYQVPQSSPLEGGSSSLPIYDFDMSTTVWQLELGDLLPVPDPRTPIDTVLAFRRDRDDERQRLIFAVRRLIADMQSAANDPVEVFDAARLELRAAMSDLERAARSNRLGVVRQSAAVTFAMAASAATQYVPGMSWILGLISGYAVNLATTKNSINWQTSPYAFLHQVKRRRSWRQRSLNPFRRHRR